MAFAMETIPTGWLKCDGSSRLRSSYPLLFAAINTLYGQGSSSNSTTFNLPDFRGAFLRGKDDGRGLDPNRNFGSYQEDEFKSHTHKITDTSSGSNGDMNNSFDTSENLNQGQPGDPSRPYVETTASGGTETRPKNYAIVYCIKE
jgi:microcystin-dependent protein